jgi:enoyl-CoA hydratase/carnithine racemase
MLPRPVGGVEAVDLGLADVLTEPGAALAGALAEATTLAAGPPLALAAIKAMLVEGPSDPYEVLAREIDNQVRLFDTDDFAEGVAAFHERRPPLFRGR